MSDNKREQERTELYRTIWALANELRGSVDGWDFKQYVLGMLFYRYISEKFDAFYRLVTGVLEKIKTNRELMEAIGTLGWHTGGEENE